MKHLIYIPERSAAWNADESHYPALHQAAFTCESGLAISRTAKNEPGMEPAALLAVKLEVTVGQFG
jgi:hypothetical protein